MTTTAISLRAPFPYFGGKSRAVTTVWQRFGQVANYVEPFCGSAAVLLAAPEGRRIETINDADGFVANFWRSAAWEPDAVAYYADWPVSEIDLDARHAWLVNRSERLRWQLEDPDFYDPKIAGYWCWGTCIWIGSGFCSGDGPHHTNGANFFNARKLPHLGDAGRGINRQLPHLGDAGRGERKEFILQWMRDLQSRLRDVRISCGDWTRVLESSVTTRHGLTGVFLDPPYTKGEMNYAAGGVGGDLSSAVRMWCVTSGNDENLRIVLCGHAGEHDELLRHGWSVAAWRARKGYANSEEALQNTADETLWCSPNCDAAAQGALDMF